MFKYNRGIVSTGGGQVAIGWGTDPQMDWNMNTEWGNMESGSGSESTHLINIYWRGLPKDEDWIRVDVERVFECIPREFLKDLIAVKKPLHNKHSMNSAANIFDEHSNSLGGMLHDEFN